MASTARLVCLVSTVSRHHKNTFRRASASGRHITKLEQSTFLRYLCFWYNKQTCLNYQMGGIRKSCCPE
jgi:hypothetical protein